MSEPQEKKKTEYVYDRQQKSFFITINNPLEHGYTHEKIIDIMHTKFKHRVYWAMCDEKGSTYHTHIYVLLSAKKRWSSVQKAYPHSHIETETRGTPQECRAYLRKEGSKYMDKAETNFPDTFYEEGEIPKVIISNDRAQMLQQIEELLNDGMRPSEIFNLSITFRQYEKIIRDHFFQKRFEETPPLREIKVYYHMGESGSGKSYHYVKLCEKYGADNVCFCSDTSNNCTAFLDKYEAQQVLFIDETKKNSFNFAYILQLLQGYRTPVHCRYSNCYSLWNEVHITSIYEPHDLYEGMVDYNNRSVDSEYQLLRRITYYVYHWKTEDGEYHEYEIPASQYTNYQDLIYMATHDGFRPVSNENNPFTESEVQADAETKIKD